MMIQKLILLPVFCVLWLLAMPAALAADTNKYSLATSPSPTASAGTHHLGPSDKIQVTVYQEDDLGTTATLDDKGMVMLPLLGKFKLGGLTVEAATQSVQDAYGKDYLVNPEVNITMLQYAARHFSVMGEVQRPGSFDIPDNENVSLLEAIALAGGYTRLGDPAKVTIQRLVNGDIQVLKVNAQAISSQKSGKLFDLLPNDIVMVGQRIF